MSAALYSTRLVWSGGRGLAKLHGRCLELDGIPMLGDIELSGIDYTPEVRVYRIQPKREGWRDMEADEIRAADQFLYSLFR